MDNNKLFAKWFYLLMKSKLRQVDETMLDAWWELLKQFPEDAIIEALKKMTYSDDEFPSVGKIVKACQPEYKQVAEDEWVKVMIQVGRGEFKFSGITKDVLNEIGGSMLLGNIHPMEKLEKRKQFIKKYEKEIETPLMLEKE